MAARKPWQAGEKATGQHRANLTDSSQRQLLPHISEQAGLSPPQQTGNRREVANEALCDYIEDYNSSAAVLFQQSVMSGI